MIRHPGTVVLLLMSSPLLHAQEPLPWSPAKNNPRVTVNPDAKVADGPWIEVKGTAGPSSTTVLQLDHPDVPSHRYVLSGRVRYEGVEGDGYVEMLNTFPGRGTFFTRTRGEAGTMAKLTGSSDWRDLELPFMSEPGLLPEKIVVNVVLQGKGTVYLAPLSMSAYQGALATAWWTDSQAG